MVQISDTLATAVEHHRSGRLAAAAEIYRQLLARQPANAQVLHLLGVVLHQQGQHPAAVEMIGRALEIDAAEPAFHNHLGEAYRAQGQLNEALACYRRALGLNPSYLAAHHNLGLALRQGGRLEEALACFRRALDLNPREAQTHLNLGNLLKDLGQLEAAVAAYGQALQLVPGHPGALNNLGNAFQHQGRLDEAVACYRRVLELQPDHAPAWSNLGNALKEQGHWTEALACQRKSLALDPQNAQTLSNLGAALKEQGRLDEALTCFREALDRWPDSPALHSNCVAALQYAPESTPATLAEAHAAYQQRHAAPLEPTTPLSAGPAQRDRLRVGFLSPDLRWHPVGRFLVRVFEHLAQQPLELYAYCDHRAADGVTARLRAAAPAWREVAGMDDATLAAQIAADRIDVLFDLAGHTAHNRLLVFARRPAPLQITWLGYEGTTGLKTIDCLLADRFMAPAESEPHFVERVLRMPDGYVCYDPPADAPEPGPLPALSRAAVTFGSFSNLAKVNPQVVARWAEILSRVPQSRLVLKAAPLADAGVCDYYRGQFAQGGIPGERLLLRPHDSYSAYLSAYQEIDIVLDPFPFSGSAVTCDALWMGVPVVTLAGATFAGRHGLSHLSNVGLPEFVADSPQRYVDLAVETAGDLPRLAALRATLRQRMAASPLCDGPRFAAHLATLLHTAWRERIESPQMT